MRPQECDVSEEAPYGNNTGEKPRLMKKDIIIRGDLVIFMTGMTSNTPFQQVSSKLKHTEVEILGLRVRVYLCILPLH